jgi:hypothetical protein
MRLLVMAMAMTGIVMVMWLLMQKVPFRTIHHHHNHHHHQHFSCIGFALILTWS